MPAGNMNAIHSEQSQASPELAPSPPLLRTVVACDLVESTALTEQLGDRAAADFMRQLDRRSRDLLEQHGGQEIDKTDGFLLLFERPIQAVAFALDYQRLLRELGEIEFLPLRARIGIHVGDVVLWRNAATDVARGAKPVEIEGLVKPVAARLMSLALPGQILLSSIAHALALRAQDELPTDREPPQWRAHGRYRFKGIAEPIEVFEVGEPGIAPLQAPAYSGKAYREVPWWRRPGALAVEAALLIAAIAIPAYMSLRSPPAIAFGERDWIVVGGLNNQTGESILNDSLQTAFRIGLEQSSYVNVLSDLKVRDTLALMQRDPEKTRIDRAVGSEVAIRDGARALILPTVAEVGGRVRITAEVIDPHSQSTVYSETAEGVGYGSVLPSLDKVSQQLRLRLGEALASVQMNNAPLPQVTTANLDALRTYSLGLQAYAQSHYADALELFRHAVKLDPDFALAYMGIARVYVGENDDASSRDYIEKAAALKDRLSARDQLYVDAWLSARGPPGPMLAKWKLLGKLYPDYYAAHYNFAYFAYVYENRYADAIAAIQPALSEHDSLRSGAYYTLGALQAAQEEFEPALKSFRIAADMGNSAQGLYYASALAATRRFTEAEKLLDSAKPSGMATEDIFLTQERIALAVDQGQWQHACEISSGLTQAAAKIGPRQRLVGRGTELSLSDLSEPKSAQRAALKEFIADAHKIVDTNTATNHDDDVFAVLLGAYLAARADDKATAQAALALATPQARGSGFPNLEHMLAIVEGELAMREGRAEDAVARLQSTTDGTELYLTHVALADAFTSAGRTVEALDEARWLTQHRGRAYLEWNSSQVLQARNVAESEIALLRKAELEHALAQDDKARADLVAFDLAWPSASQLPFLAGRLSALKQSVGKTSSSPP